MSRLLPILLCTAAIAGCATSSMQRARMADELRDHDLAVAEYTEALRQNPGDADARAALDRAKVRAAAEHHLRGRRLMTLGRYEEAALELQIATELNPASREADTDLRAARTALREQLTATHGAPTELEAILARAADLKPEGPVLPDTKLPGALTTGRQTTSGELYRTIAMLMNLSVAFDPAFRETPAEVRLEAGMPLDAALDAVASASATFYRVTGPNAILVVNDTPAKQREYLQEAARMIPLQNLDLKETIDALRITHDARKIAPFTPLNAFAVADTPERLEALMRFVSAIDKARAELVVDVEILEVNRSLLREYGVQIASPGSPGIDGSLSIDRDVLSLEDLRNLSRANVLSAGIPALYYRLLKTDSRTRTLANSRLRISDGTQARASFGQEIPVVQSIIQPFAQGGEPVQQQSVQYQTIGVNISMTPRTHPNDEVSLSLDIELSTLGDSLNDLPTFGTRQVVTAIRLRDGETNILGGLIRDDERTARETVPGLGDIPVLGRMFGRNRREAEQTDVVVMLTPHILRSMSITADDLRPFLLPRDAIGAGMLDIGPTVPPPPVVRPPGGGGGSGGGVIAPEFMLPSFPVTAASPSGTIVPLARPAAEPLPAGGGRR